MTATEIAALLTQRGEDVCHHLLPNGCRKGKDWCVGSIGGEPGDSMQVTLEGSKAGVWCDWAGGPEDRGDMIGLWKRVRNVSLETACREALDWLQVPEAQRNDRSHQPKPPRKKEEPKAPDQRWLELQSTMRPGTISELSALAELRKLPGTAGLELATRHGQLWFGSVHDHGERHPAWIITDGSRRNAQARKTDGSLWVFNGNRKPAKSKGIWGTDPRWPVGLHEATTPEIAFVEGGPDFLAAWHVIWHKQMTATVRPVGMFGASNPIHEDALPLFKGKRVWIFPHNDQENEGLKAAWRWRAQLLEAGAQCMDFFDFSEDGVKDLNDLVTLSGVKSEAAQ